LPGRATTGGKRRTAKMGVTARMVKIDYHLARGAPWAFSRGSIAALEPVCRGNLVA